MSAIGARLRNSSDPWSDLCELKQLTPAGCDWVKRAIDPFHDYELPNFRGFPDGAAEAAVPYTIKQQMVVSNPTGNSGAWDCHVSMNPVDAVLTGFSGIQAADAFYFPHAKGITGPGTIREVVNSGSDRFKVSGVSAQAVPSGEDTWSYIARWRTQDPDSDKYSCQNLDVSNYVDDLRRSAVSYRVVAAGFEVVNSTAPLHQQGDVTVYHVPAYPDEQNVRTTEVTSANYDGSTIGTQIDYYTRTGKIDVLRSPPRNVADAKQTIGARTWAAKDGCYVPARLHSDNRFGTLGKHDYVFTNSYESRSGESSTAYAQDICNYHCGVSIGRYENSEAAVGNSLWAQTLLGNSTESDQDGAEVHMTSMDISGAFFTGLSAETTLTVSYVVHLELIPGANNRASFALAVPTAPRDPVAIDLYLELCRLLPPGVPVSYNDAGKWFKMVTNATKTALDRVMPYLPMIEAALIAGGRPAAAGLVAAAANAAKSRKKAIPNHGKP